MSVDIVTTTCPGDRAGRAHKSRPQIVQKFYRGETPGKWTAATITGKATRADKQRTGPHIGDAPTGARPQDLKHDFACRLCGNSLQIGVGQWSRLEAALETVAEHLGDEVTLDTLRLAYAACGSSRDKLTE